MEILGIDIGGSGIKGAIVDTEKGELITERYRIPTPQPSLPEAVADVVVQICEHFNWKGPIGCTFPSVVKNGITYTAANVDDAWIEFNAAELLSAKTGQPVLMINDADAAGIAEMKFGAGKDNQGVVFILTFGTGIGSCIFVNGQLVPNTELGHMEVRKKDAEHRAADKIRKDKNLSWEEWAEKVDEFLGRIDDLFWPDLVIFGGGVSKKSDNFFPYLNPRAELVTAQLLNNAGIIGAAIAAQKLTSD